MSDILAELNKCLDNNHNMMRCCLEFETELKHRLGCILTEETINDIFIAVYYYRPPQRSMTTSSKTDIELRQLIEKATLKNKQLANEYANLMCQLQRMKGRQLTAEILNAFNKSIDFLEVNLYCW